MIVDLLNLLSRVDYAERDKSGERLANGDVVYRVPLPGVKKQNLTINAVRDALDLKWKKGDHEWSYRYHVNSRDFDPKATRAKLEDGELELTFVRRAEAQSTQIQIE